MAAARRMCVWLGCAALVVLVLAAGPAGASPPATVAQEPIPDWISSFGTARPQQDALDTALVAAMSDFRTGSDWNTAVAKDCAGVFTAYNAASDLEDKMHADFNNLTDLFAAMTTNDVTAAALLANHVTQLASAVAAWNVAAKEVAAALDATVSNPELVKNIGAAVVGTANEVQNIRAAEYTGSYNGIDGLLNSLTNGVGRLAAYAKSPELKKLGGPLAQRLLALTAAVNEVTNAVNDLIEWHSTLTIEAQAYFQAAAHYSKHISDLKDAVTKMKTEMRENCPPKKKPDICHHAHKAGNHHCAGQKP